MHKHRPFSNRDPHRREHARIFAGLLTIALLVSVAPCVTHAQQTYPLDLTVTFVNPSDYDDGSTIVAGDLAGTRLVCQRDGTDVVDELLASMADPGAAEQHTLVGVIPAPGTYECVAFAVTTDDVESAASNTATRRYTGRPLAPGALTIVFE